MNNQDFSMFSPDPALVFIGLTVSMIYGVYQLYQASKDADKGFRRRIKEYTGRNATKRLSRHAERNYLEKKLIKVKGGDIHVAVGYGSSNCILIEGPKGCVVINAGDSNESARQMLEAFKQVTQKPIVALILSSCDRSLMSGLDTFNSAEQNIKIYIHETFGRFSTYDDCFEAQRRRVIIDGVALDQEEKKLGTGLGNVPLSKRYSWSSTLESLNVQRVEKEMKIAEGGLELVLRHSPGSSDDHLIVWWEKHKVLFPGKDLFCAMPNAFGIDSGYSRSVRTWIESLDLMISLDPEIMVPSFTRPSANKEEIRSALEAYQNALQLLHDQTIRWMNKGKYPDEIVELLYLPQHLEDHEFLKEFYGNREFIIRGLFNHYMGWFSGDPADLHPLTLSEEANYIVELANGTDRIVEGIQQSIDWKEYDWAFQMMFWLREAKKQDDQVKEMFVNMLRTMADRDTCGPARNWYLSRAKEIETGKGIIESGGIDIENRLDRCNIQDVIRFMSIAVDPIKSINVDLGLLIELTDIKASCQVQIRNCVLSQVYADNEENDDVVRVKATLKYLKKFLRASDKDRKNLIASTEFEISDTEKFTKFMKCIDADTFY